MAGRILIAGVDEPVRELASTLRRVRYDVAEVSTVKDLLASARSAAYDLLLLDDQIDGVPPLKLCRRLKSESLTRDLPIILVSGRDSSALRRSALEAGADEVLATPHDETMLLARVRSILRMRETSEELRRRRTTATELGFAESAGTFAPPGRVTLVTDTETGAEWREALRPLLRHDIRICDPETVFEAAESGSASDVYVIDGSSDPKRHVALRLIPDLRSRSASRHAGILVVCCRRDGACGAMALDLGANDLVPADFEAPEMALRLRSQLRRKREADLLRASVDEDLRLAAMDPLTGLYNRRYAMLHLTKISTGATRTGRSFAVMLADLDRFKAVNDRFGHSAGDAVLVEVARRLRDNLRSNDLVARIGGEEFLIAMPDTGLAEARVAAERLCRMLEQTPVPLPSGDEVTITLSIGVAVGGGRKEAAPVAALIEQADRALYGSKAEGRNQVTISPAA